MNTYNDENIKIGDLDNKSNLVNPNNEEKALLIFEIIAFFEL